MKALSWHCVLLHALRSVCTTVAEPHYEESVTNYPHPTLVVSAWPEPVAECSSVLVTVIETETITQPGSPITVVDTVTSKSGTVLNTTQTATSSALKRRHFGSKASFTWVSAVWTDYDHCSASTSTITSTEYTTEVLPDSTIIDTTVVVQPASTLSCPEGCKVDVTATKLIYPNSVIHVTVPVTVDSLPEAHTPSALTWEFNGVTLTYPTTYLFYSELSHAYLAVTATSLATTCPTASGSLTLPSPTNYAPLIYPQQETPGPDLPPHALISYLNGQETVLVQLSGTPIGSSCDPVGGGIVEPVAVPQTGPPQIIYTSTYILAKTTSTTATLIAEISGNSTSTSLSSSYSMTAAATFASTGTSTVVIYSHNTTAAPTVEVVSIAHAHRAAEFNAMGLEAWLLGMAGVILAWL